MAKVTTTKRIVTVPEMIEAIKEHYNLNDTLLAINLKVTNQTIKAWKEGKKPRKDSYLELTELYKGICEEIHQETTEEVEEVTEVKKPYEISYPEDDVIMYYIDDYTGGIKQRVFDKDDGYDKYLYEIGLYFQIEQQAEQFLKEQTLIKKIKCYVKEQQGDWEPNWEDTNQKKYYIAYDFELETVHVIHNKYYTVFSKLPYFKSKEIAQACIDEFGDEILEVFC
jgi:hypothetical protein